MKQVIAMLIVLLVAATAQADITAWLMGTPDVDNPDVEYLARVGIIDRLQETEFGVQSNWLGTRGAGQWYGAYGILHLEGDPASILGQPYIGYQASIIDAEDGGSYGPVAGTVYREIFVIEYQYRDFTGRLSEELADFNDAHKVFVGLRLRF